MARLWIRISLSFIAICFPFLFSRHAEASQCCQSNKQYTLIVTVDGVTAATNGSLTGTPAPVQPNQELNVNWQLQLTGGGYGENPSIICQLNSTVLFNKQESPGGGGFPFYMPAAPGTYYFSCSISGAPGGMTPKIALTVN